MKKQVTRSKGLPWRRCKKLTFQPAPELSWELVEKNCSNLDIEYSIFIIPNALPANYDPFPLLLQQVLHSEAAWPLSYS